MASDRPANNDLDKSLLDRLSALKGSTSITLDTNKTLNPLNPPSTTTANDTAQVKPTFAIGPVPSSVSKEDALTERLWVLRNAPSSSVPSSGSGREGAQAPAVSPKPESDSQAYGHGISKSQHETKRTPVSRITSQQSSKAEDTTTKTQAQILSSAWDLEEVDDHALDELLEGLQDDLKLQEDVSDGDRDDINFHAIANNKDDGIIENDEEKVQKLLSELALKPNTNSFADDNHNYDDEDDDSDSEAMTKETNKIINQVQDEINLNGGPTDEDPFSLPSPPSGTRTPTFTSTSQPTSPQITHLNLPTVPSTLSPPLGQEDPNDITSLTARLSHLRSTPIKTDAFGLPSVPTTTLILPADSSLSPPPPVSTKYQTKSTKNWVGRSETYTDEDVKKWCTVCLEDATIRCEGCEDEGYCVRCWREMHVGPQAGWEERGHRWFRVDGSKGNGKGDWSGPTTPM